MCGTNRKIKSSLINLMLICIFCYVSEGQTQTRSNELIVHPSVNSRKQTKTKTIKMRFTASLRNLNKLLDTKSLKSLDKNSQFTPSPLTIQKFLEFGQVLINLFEEKFSVYFQRIGSK